MGWWNAVWEQRADQWTYIPLSAGQTPDDMGHTPVAVDEQYVSVFLRSMRVTHVRQGLRRFYGAVQSHITVPHLSGAKAEFNVITTPATLLDVSPQGLDRVITLNRRLLGPIPYRGGDMNVELGLFSITSVDLTDPFLKLLTTMAEAAGVAFIAVATPFVRPLLEGVQLLFGAQGPEALEVGMSTTWAPPETGYYLIIRAQRGSIDTETVRVDKNDYAVIDANGQAIGEYPYMLVYVEASDKRDDWFSIPELAASYAALRQALLAGETKPIQDAQTVFNHVAQNCLDLIPKDAEQLVRKVDGIVKPQLTGLAGPRPETIPELHEIEIYASR
jgi:hypothetical protein